MSRSNAPRPARSAPAARPDPSQDPDRRRIDELTRALRERATKDPAKFAKLLTDWIRRPASKRKEPANPPYRRRKLG